MEKSKPSYSLADIKQSFLRIEQLGLCITGTAFRTAQELGFSREDIMTAVQALKSTEFYKSMTSQYDHRIWQDVYHLRFRGLKLYVKFTITKDGFLLLSFKEK